VIQDLLNYVWVSNVGDNAHGATTQWTHGNVNPKAAPSKTRLSRRAQVRGAINSSATSDSVTDLRLLRSIFALFFLHFVGTTSFLIRAFGANTP